jgi:hypothetical protein
MYMKKFLPGILMVLFAVGLSAFTASTPVKKASLDTYFWYEIENGVTVGDPINSSEVDQEAAESFINGCDLRDGEICLAGFETDNVPANTAAPSPTTAEDNLLYKP